MQASLSVRNVSGTSGDEEREGEGEDDDDDDKDIMAGGLI